VFCAKLCTPGNCLRKLDLRSTCLCGTTFDAATGYTLEGIGVLCTALAHTHCVLEHLELSENAIRADREEQAPSSLPLPIGQTDVERLAALHPDVRLAMLRSLDYPAHFREAAQRKGLVPPVARVPREHGGQVADPLTDRAVEQCPLSRGRA